MTGFLETEKASTIKPTTKIKGKKYWLKDYGKYFFQVFVFFLNEMHLYLNTWMKYLIFKYILKYIKILLKIV